MVRGWPSGSQSAWPEDPAQSPNWVCASSALGPMTATVRGPPEARGLPRPSSSAARPPANGSVPSLVSRTSERRAASRFSTACAPLPMTSACRAASGWRGFSKRPSSNLSVRMRRTAASISDSVNAPCATASWAPAKKFDVVITMSLPARTAAADACA
ncbi:hypothetical protein M2436_004188 [Streptomyces sp. HB372]|nr:hypothetical protein [Streptomyces sp. HB372]